MWRPCPIQEVIMKPSRALELSRPPVVGLLLAGDKTHPGYAAFSEEMEALGSKCASPMAT